MRNWKEALKDYLIEKGWNIQKETFKFKEIEKGRIEISSLEGSQIQN